MQTTRKVSSLTAYQLQDNVFHAIANNLSNIQTPGFKKDFPVFHTMLSQSAGELKRFISDETKIAFQQGDLQKTGSDLDLAVEGEGFFKVRTPHGIRYTRAGNFRLNKEKVLTSADGFPVMGSRGELVLNGQKIVVEKDGTLKMDGSEVDRISPVNFADLQSLKKEGQGLFRLEGFQEEQESPETQVIQGQLESSNVNSVEEMVKLIDALRAYESCLKTIQSQDEIDSKAANELGKV